MAHTTKDAAIKLAHTIVRPAVEAATAELRAELERVKAERDRAVTLAESMADAAPSRGGGVR